MYDMMVLAIPVAFLVRIGLKRRLSRLRASGAGAVRLLLFLTFMFTGSRPGLAPR